MGNGSVVSEPQDKEAISEEAIHDELGRILESSMFVQSDRLGRFLRFTIETTLAGDAEMLKEYLIGTEVYERNPSYNPSEDSIVRSEARRLRRKLNEYYESVGKDDSIFIYYRLGSYVPVFRLRLSQDRDGAGKDGGLGEPFVEGRGVRIAVLPFVDASRGDLSGAYARIITDELIHELVRTDGLQVTAASSVAPLITQDMDLPTLARKLNVQVVFEGTVYEDNNQLRITSRVVKADGFQIWSERFETEPVSQSLFKISERIVSALISRIRPELSPIRKKKASAGAEMLFIHPLVLAAEALLDEGTLAGLQLALSKFQEVTEIEPNYARPVCGIAQCYCEMALRGTPNSAAAISRAQQAAQRAAKLDPQMILVPACTACALALAWKWDSAEKCFQQALGLGESAGAYRQYALFLAALGRFDEAWNYLQESHQIDPFSYRQKVVYTKLLHLSRQYDKGVKYVSEHIVYGPLPIESEIYRAMMLISLDRRDEAMQLARSFVCKAGAQPVLMSAIAEVLAICGQTAAADRIASDYSLFSANSPISKFRQALLSLALENSEKAMSLLSAACEEREAELVWLAHEPRLDMIREDRRFGPLLAEVMHASSSTFGDQCAMNRGQITCSFVARTDIENRKHAEQLQADLTHASRVSTMGEMVASISHELVQPIQITTSHARASLRWLQHDPPNVTEARKGTEKIIEAGALASEIIDRLRSLYKKAPFKRELVAINEVIVEMAGMMGSEAREHGVSIRADLKDVLPVTAADRVQLQQVLMNLMLNGIEAMKDGGGVLTVKSQLCEDAQIHISIHDTGPGLPVGKVDQIFDAFFTTKPQGSGMGLAISKSIVESQGGRIWANGDGEPGATFHFTLPAAPAETNPPVNPADSAFSTVGTRAQSASFDA
jgi:C4-dicarboxylate-specific signal transduction histidine kinase/TolB-like protein